MGSAPIAPTVLGASRSGGRGRRGRDPRVSLVRSVTAAGAFRKAARTPLVLPAAPHVR
jgi:hypothetical protein